MRVGSFRLLVLPALLTGLLAAIPPASAQPFDPVFGGQAGDLLGTGTDGDIVKVRARFTAPAAGKPAGLFITATIKPGWHIYSITQPPGGPIRTRIKLEHPEGIRLLGDYQVSPPPERKREEVFDNLLVESHDGTATWYAPVELPPAVDPARLQIKGELTAQPCNASGCLPPQDFPFTAALGPDVEGPVGPATGAVTFDPDRLDIAANERLKKTSMVLAMALGFAGGVILNLMPCVLPVIGLKILSFVEQAGRSRGHALMLNIWYSLGLMSVFLLLAALAAGPQKIGWGELFSYNGFNITLAAVVFVMALSFLGVWEIPIPGFVGGAKASELAEKEGVAGAFFKGVLTTILATPCTGPFMASALAWVVGQPPLKTYAVFTSIGLGMASPYLLIGAFPELIRFLPKPGAWMDTFKQVMGFVLLGTVVYVLTFIHWPYVVPTIGMLFALWGACWWINRTPLTAEFGAKARAWLEATAFAGLLWIVLFPGIDEIIPGRYSFGGLYDVMAGRFDPRIAENELPWQAFTRSTFEELTTRKTTVLVDFTADWCMTCKTLEKYVLNTPEVRRVVDRNGVVPLHADWTHRDPEVTEMLELLGSKQVPVLAIFPAADPNRPIVLRGGYTRQILLEALQKAGPSTPSS